MCKFILACLSMRMPVNNARCTLGMEYYKRASTLGRGRINIMLNSQDFEVIQDLNPYNFKFLNPLRKQTTFTLYQSLAEDKLVKVVSTKNLYLLQNIYHLEQLGLIDGPLGYLRKGTTFYMFMDVRPEKTLLEAVKEREKLINKPYFSEDETYQFLNLALSMLYLTTEKKPELEVLVLTPKNFVMVEKSGKNQIKFRFPIEEPILQQKGVITEYLKENKEFCSPELLRELINSKNRRCCSKYGKSALYSLGLIILYMVFGETFTEKQRIQALFDHRDLENQIKFKRRQMKVFYNGKTISKIIKILLQRKELERDDIRTVRIKLLSPQFASIVKPKQELPTDDGQEFLIQHKTTRSFEDGDRFIPLERQKTIQIEVMRKSGNTVNNSSIKGSIASTIKESKLTMTILPSIQDEPEMGTEYDSETSSQPLKGSQCFRILQEVTSSFPIEDSEKQFSLTLKKKTSVSSRDGGEPIQPSIVSLGKSAKEFQNNFSGLKFSGRVQELRKYKLISYLLFGVVVLLVGLCLLYLSLFSEG